MGECVTNAELYVSITLVSEGHLILAGSFKTGILVGKSQTTASLWCLGEQH